jgi:16S rRNA (guanine(966)-N(2))-methyltransferase RsmD
MRVIAGSAKGFRLKVPKKLATRPATELVRGAIFSILETMADDWSQVLDIFSGSGSLGIEALSRGAGWIDFVEKEPRCCAIIRDNLEKTGFDTQAHVYCTSVTRAIAFLDKEYDIILMDPPYSDMSIGNTVNQLAGSGLVGAPGWSVKRPPSSLPTHRVFLWNPFTVRCASLKSTVTATA